MNLAENIVRLRKGRGLTQARLAEELNMTSAAVSKWETGAAVPDLDTLVALADYFRISIDELLGHRPKKHTAVVFYPQGEDEQMIRRSFAKCDYRLLGLGRSTAELDRILAEQEKQNEYVEFLISLMVGTHMDDHTRDQLGDLMERYHYGSWCGLETSAEHLERSLQSFLSEID